MNSNDKLFVLLKLTFIPALALAKDQKPVALDVIHGGIIGESTTVMNKLYLTF